MLAVLNGKIEVGPAYAAVPLQLHLGLGLAVAAVCSAARSSAPLRRRLEGVPWQATLQACIAAAGPSLLLTVFALIQVRGEVRDLLTPLGLLVAEAATILGVLLTFLGPLCGGEVPEVDGQTGDTLSKCFDDGTSGAAWFGRLSKLLGALRALGLLLLFAAALPSAVEFICLSALVRLALLAQALAAILRVLTLDEGPLAWACADMSRILKVVPLVGAVVLLDKGGLLLVDASSSLAVLLHPSFYCVLIALAQVALALAVRLGIGAEVEEVDYNDFDFSVCSSKAEVRGAERIMLLKRTFVWGFHIALATLVAKVTIGTLSVSVSSTGLCIEWHDFLVATAAGLAQLLLLQRLAECAVGPTAASEGAAAATQCTSNGVSAEGTLEGEAADDEEQVPAGPTDAGVAEHSSAGGVGGLLGGFREITSCLPAVMLAMAMPVAAADPQVSGSAIDLLLQTPAAVLRYSFVLVAAAAGFQVLLLVLFSICHSSEASLPVPPLDATGILRWEPQGKGVAPKALAASQRIAELSLESGLLLGCVGLGVKPWTIPLLFLSMLYPLLPTSAKAVIKEIFSWVGALVIENFEVLEKHWRSAQEAAASKREARSAAEAQKLLTEWEGSSKQPKRDAQPEDKPAKASWKAASKANPNKAATKAKAKKKGK